MKLDLKASVVSAGTVFLLLLPFAACGGSGGREPNGIASNAQPPSGAIVSPANNVTLNPGQAVTFFGTATDPGGNPVFVVWDFGDGTPSSTEPMAGNHVFAASGTFTVTMSVTNSLGMADPTPETRTITVLAGGGGAPANGAPSGTITSPAADVNITEGQSVAFAGSVSDPDGDPVTVFWDFGDGTAPSTLLAPGSHAYAAAGVYTVTMTATDAQGLAATVPATRTVSVQAVAGNNPPNGTISAPAGNVTITAGQSVAFAGATTDPDSNPVTVVWSFGDGTATTNNLNPGNHTFSTAGTFTVTLTATDSLGLDDPTPATRVITVNPVAAAATFTQVKTFFTASCTGCHGAGGDAGLDLRAANAFTNLVGVNATTLGGVRVQPGNSANSALLTKLQGGHRSAAQGNTPANRDLIASWIDAGALNN